MADLLSEAQQLIRESARELLANECGHERLRRILDDDAGWDADLWARFAGELGFAGLMTPEAYGGSGLGAIEMALVLEEVGRVLAPIPFLETAALAVKAILAAGNPAQKEALLPGLASGAVTAAFAGASDRPVLADGRLVGRSHFVTFANVADLLLVATQDESLIVLRTSTAGIRIERESCLDRTRPFATVTFDLEVGPHDLLGPAGSAREVIEHVLALGAGLLASEQTGTAQFCLDSTVEYVKQRVQFGRPIGSFQAVKHELADMMVLVEASRSAALYAASAIDGDADEVAEACAVAASWASEACRHCSAEAIQLHGGIGFTWEHPAHLYFKRARASSAWLGTPEEHLEALAKIVLKEAPCT